MNQNSTLSIFGTASERITKARDILRKGGGVIVVDDENRENEGDLIFSAEMLTSEQMARMIRDCSGIVCLCMTDEKRRSLGLEMMTRNNRSSFGTAFTVSIEAVEGVTTGVSACDRVTTIRTALRDDATSEHIASPGHVFPLVVREGGVLERDGHTEATVDLMKISGLKPMGVLCELTNPDGTMMRLPELMDYAEIHGFIVLSIQDIKEHMSVHA